MSYGKNYIKRDVDESLSQAFQGVLQVLAERRV